MKTNIPNGALSAQYQTRQGRSFAIGLLLTLLVLLVPAAAHAAFKTGLEGQQASSTNWVNGPLNGWHELDYIPFRVTFSGGPATNQVVTINFDHSRGTVPGLENLTGFTPSSNVIITAGPTLSAPTGANIWTYTFTIAITDNQPGDVEFLGRLAAGSHGFPGASLNLSGPGNVQVAKPGAFAGNPDLAITKVGPAQAKTNQIITYAITYTNKLSPATIAVGVQVSDILPAEVSYVPGSASTGATIVGNTITWDVGNLRPGGHGLLTYKVLVTNNLPVTTTFANYAQVLYSQDDANPSDNTSSVNTTVVITPIPLAADDQYSMDKNGVLSVSAPGVLLNDSNALSATLFSGPLNGTVSFNTNGSFIYTPATNFVGTDIFVYRAVNGTNFSGPGVVSVVVTNAAPVAASQAVTTPEDTAANIVLTATDLEADPLTFAIVTGPANGTLSGFDPATGAVTYTPGTNFNGSDSFTFQVSDGMTNSAVATVNLAITPVDDAPVAYNQNVTIREGSSTNFVLTATDVDSSNLVYAILDGPAHGTLGAIDSNTGAITYTSVTNYSGEDSFTFTAFDGSLYATGTVSLAITPIAIWSTPASITYGTPLSSSQLNATSSAPGVYVYTPTFGAVLPVGAHTLNVVFTPTDTNYAATNLSVPLVVTPATLTISPDNQFRVYNQPNPTLSYTVTGFVNGENSSVLSGAPALSTAATTSSPVGAYPITATLGTLAAANYTFTYGVGTLDVISAAASAAGLAWTPQSPITYGTPLGTNQLNATATIVGTFDYSPTNGTVLPVGTNTLNVTFTPTDTNYTTANLSVFLVVTPATLTVTVNDASRAYNQPNPAFTGSITGLQNGDLITATYDTTATLSSPVGIYPITPTLVDASNQLASYTVVTNIGTLTITTASAASEGLSWTPESPIVYGTPLGTNQLNATATIAGTFDYSPTNGTVLPVGTNTLNVIFTPADTNYATANLSVLLVVTPATLTVTANDAARAYNQPNPGFTGSISGLQNGDQITATYDTTATLSSPVGTYPITPALVDASNQLANYTVVTNIGTLTITTASSASEGLAWTPESPIVYGTPLGTNQLNASATIAGTFDYSPTNGTVLPAGTNILNVIFTPADTNYATANLSVQLLVIPATLTITPDNKSRPYAQANPALTYAITGFVNGEDASVIAGAPDLATTATVSSPVSTYPITATLGTLVAANYTFAFAPGTLSVTIASDDVAWNPESPIVYGTPLSTNQLNATASVPGSFEYSPTNGAVLPAGTNTLSLVFTPDDTNYLAVTQTAPIVVTPATLTVTAGNVSRPYGQTNPVLGGIITGLQNGDVITATYATVATLSSPVGLYPITSTLTDVDNRLPNYIVVANDGVLTVTASTGAVTWTPPGPIVYGTALDTNQLNAAATVPGSFVYSPTNGAVLPAGTNTLSLVFSPTDTNYNTVNLSVPLVVLPATLTVTPDNKSRPYAQANPALTYAITGFVNGEDASVIAGTPDLATTATLPSPVSTYPITATLGTLTSTNYTFDFAPGALSVTIGSDDVAWLPQSPIVYGTVLDTNQLNATATVPGTFVYSPTNGAVLPAGTNTLSLVFTPADTNYPAVIQSLPIVVTPATLTVTAGNVSRAYGQTNPPLTYSIIGFVNGENVSVVSGTPALSTTATLSSPVGTYPIAAALGTLAAANYSFAFAPGTLSVTIGSDSVSWTPQSPIVYGTLLSTNQLNATATVPGSFVYSPTNGAVLPAGTNALSLVFTPTDTNYNTVNLSVPLLVLPATLTVTPDNKVRAYAQANPALTYSITGFVNGENVSVISGTPALSTTAALSSPVGAYPITVALGTLAAANYSFAFAPGTLNVTIGSDSVSWTPQSPIVYGTPLSTNQLNATATVPGTFVYSPTNGAVLPAGTNTLSLVFTPTDTNYPAVAQTAPIVVTPATLTVTAGAVSRAYGQTNPPLTYSITGFVNGENVSVISGTPALFTTATMSSPVGAYPITAALGTLAAANYSFAFAPGTLSVTIGNDSASWTPQSPIVYGTPLSTNQLNATATVPGSFVYSPTNGAVLPAGTNTLSLVFTPTDTNYNTVNLSVPLVVLPATLAVTPDNKSRPYAQANPALTYSITGFVNGESVSVISGTPALSTTATISSAMGTYPITATHGTLAAANYSFAFAPGTLSVTIGSDSVSWTPQSPIVYGTPLSTNQLNATVTVPGSFVYSPTNGAVLPAGTNTLSLVFTPTDTNYNTVNLSVPLVVLPATLTVTADNASRTYGQTNPVFSGTITGLKNGDVITATYATSASPGSPVGAYPIIPTLVDPANRLPNYTVVAVNGTLTVSPGTITLTWTPAGPIIYGTAVGTSRLNATATGPGTFAYSVASSAVLPVGTNTLSVVFTPTDTNYNSVNLSVPLVVMPATLTVSADNKTRYFGQVNPPLTYAISGFVNGENAAVILGVPALATSALTNSPVGVYPISVSQGSLAAANYAFTFSNGTLTVTEAPPVFSIRQGTSNGLNAFNPQTGLYEQTVTVTNVSASTVAAVRLLVGDIRGTNGALRTDVRLWNASGTNTADARPFVQYNAPLDPGSHVTFTLEFYNPMRTPFTNSVEAVAVLPAAVATNLAGGVAIDRAYTDIRTTGSMRFLIEWTSIPGRSYTVIYSDDMIKWQAATPTVQATATRTQWYDDGAPKTISPPSSVGSRVYRIILNP